MLGCATVAVSKNVVYLACPEISTCLATIILDRKKGNSSDSCPNDGYCNGFSSQYHGENDDQHSHFGVPYFQTNPGGVEHLTLAASTAPPPYRPCR